MYLLCPGTGQPAARLWEAQHQWRGAVDWLIDVDWQAMLVPTHGLLEIFLRGTAVYFLLLLLLRVFPRQAGSIGISDLLVVVLIADAAQNAMSSDYKSITEGAVLVVTIILWDRLLDRIGYRVPAVERLLRRSPLLLIKDGHAIRRNLRQEMITTDELMSQLRQHGVTEIAKVRRAYMEGDGQISVVKFNDDGGDKPRRRLGT